MSVNPNLYNYIYNSVFFKIEVSRGTDMGGYLYV